MDPRTSPHAHPDGVMVTPAGVRRRRSVGDGPSREVRLALAPGPPAAG